MISKLPKISKDQFIIGIVVFAALCFRTVFALTQTSHFVATHIIYLLIAFVPLSILLASSLSDNVRKEFKAVDIIAIIVIIYALLVVLHNTVIRYYILTAIGIFSVSLLLCKSIYLLPVAAILNLVSSLIPELGVASAVSIPVVICFSMVGFSYIFEKQKTSSKKKNKKTESEAILPDYKKEKIIFAISEIILLASLAVMVYMRKTNVALISFRSNLEYIIPFAVVAVCIIIFAVLTIKNKKPFIGFIGYAVVIATTPLTQLANYEIAACGTFAAFTLLLMLANPKLETGKLIEEKYQKLLAKINKTPKSAEE